MYELKFSSDIGLELFKGDDGDFVLEGVLVLGPLARLSVSGRDPHDQQSHLILGRRRTIEETLFAAHGLNLLLRKAARLRFLARKVDAPPKFPSHDSTEASSSSAAP